VVVGGGGGAAVVIGELVALAVDVVVVPTSIRGVEVVVS